MRPSPFLVVPLAFLAHVGALPAAPVQSVSQFGITWQFEKPVEAGQFANGDWWVIAPVTVTEITPKPEADRNGSMLNPLVNATQAFDARIRNNEFESGLNVAANLPLTILKPASLLSAESHLEDTVKDNVQLRTIAILTVLDTAPPEGAFRPPYQGDDKAIIGKVSDLDYSVLAKLPPVGSSPDLNELAARLERPWIELKTNWTGRYMHPEDNQPSYGREMAHLLGEAVLALQLDKTDEEKKALLVNLTQIGIDIYGAARGGAAWGADGAHNQGRKLPMLLAGKVLRHQGMLDLANAEKNMIFQEDQQTFYVTQEDVYRERTPNKKKDPEPYTPEMVGKPEWGIRHSSKPGADSMAWDAPYRVVSGAPTITHALAARLMNLQQDWAHPAFFDYYDRYWEMEKDHSDRGPNGIGEFTRDMWQAYRDKVPVKQAQVD